MIVGAARTMASSTPDRLISVCLKRQHQSFYFLCSPLATPEYLKRQVQSALQQQQQQEQPPSNSTAAASNNAVVHTNLMRIVFPNDPTTPLQDDATLEQLNVKDQAELHLIFAKPVVNEYNEDNDDDDNDEKDEDEELEWEEPDVVSHALQQEARPKE